MSLITILLAAASVVGAIPTLQTRADSGLDYIIDPWAKDAPPGEKGVTPAAPATSKRQVPVNIPNSELPGCDVDPSFEFTKNTAYKANQGIKMPKPDNSKDDSCTTGTGDDHCWTEYYIVERAIEYTNWHPQGGSIDCSTTSQCNSASAASNQTCTTTGSTITNGVDSKLLEASIDFELNLGIIKTHPTVSHAETFTHSNAKTTMTTVCNTDTNTNTCQWDDKKCHQLFEADRVIHYWGQMQRVCNGQTSVKVQQQSKRDDGKWVRGQHGFEYFQPVNTIQGCGASCQDHDYKLQLPANEGRQPFPKPEGW